MTILNSTKYYYGNQMKGDEHAVRIGQPRNAY